MGTTATSLHVLSAVVGVGSRLPEDIEKAYRKLGYVRPKKAGGGATKRVILAPDASGDWLSIYDLDERPDRHRRAEAARGRAHQEARHGRATDQRLRQRQLRVRHVPHGQAGRRRGERSGRPCRRPQDAEGEAPGAGLVLDVHRTRFPPRGASRPPGQAAGRLGGAPEGAAQLDNSFRGGRAGRLVHARWSLARECDDGLRGAGRARGPDRAHDACPRARRPEAGQGDSGADGHDPRLLPVGRRLPLPQVLSGAVAAASRRVGQGTVGDRVQRRGHLGPAPPPLRRGPGAGPAGARLCACAAFLQRAGDVADLDRGARMDGARSRRCLPG